MRSHRTLLSVAAALAALGLTTAACGGDDSGSTADQAGAASSAKAPSVKVVEAAATPGRLPFYVAYFGGFFDKHGVKVDLVEAQTGAQGAQLLAGGKVQFQLGQLSDALNSVLAKEPVSVLATLNQRYNNSLVVSSKLRGKVKSFGDLAGVPLGITGVGSGTWQFANYLGRLGGVDKSKLKLVNIGGAQIASGQSLMSGRVGAQVSNDPTDLKLVNSGKAYFLADPLDLNQGVSKQYPEWVKLATEPYVYNVLSGTKDYVQAHKDVTQKMLDALQDAENFVFEKPPEETAALLLKHEQIAPFGKDLLTQTVERARDTSQSLPKTFEVSEEGYANTVKVASELKKAYLSVPFGDAVDNSFAQKAASTVGEPKSTTTGQ